MYKEDDDRTTDFSPKKLLFKKPKDGEFLDFFFSKCKLTKFFIFEKLTIFLISESLGNKESLLRTGPIPLG